MCQGLHAIPRVLNCKFATIAQHSATLGMPVQPKKVSYLGAYAVALVSLLSGAAVVHNIFKPDLVRVCERLIVPRRCARHVCCDVHMVEVSADHPAWGSR